MEESKFRKKITWFNFICCLLVIWNHAGNADLFFGTEAAAHPLYRFEYQIMPALIRVNIPCFMMISGYLFFRDFTWEKLSGKWKRRIKTLLIPYLLWNLLYYAGYYISAGYEANYDIYDLSGWGPDYGDPQTYLSAMLPWYEGYMTRMLGIF